MEENKPSEFRLYEYKTGILYKVGRGKTGNRPHIYAELDACIEKVNSLREKYVNTQFVIVEYFGPFRSRIHTII